MFLIFIFHLIVVSLGRRQPVLLPITTPASTYKKKKRLTEQTNPCVCLFGVRLVPCRDTVAVLASGCEAKVLIHHLRECESKSVHREDVVLRQMAMGKSTVTSV